MTWKPKGTKFGAALIKAAERRGTGTLTTAQTRKQTTKARRKTKPGISAACQRQHHGQCYKMNCECECHPKC